MITNKILYFPYINVPKNNWLKVALLYWDQVGSIVPSEYTNRPELLHRNMLELVRENLIEQIVPENYIGYIHDFGQPFISFIDNDQTFKIIRKMAGMGLTGRGGVIQYTTKIHRGKLNYIAEELVRRKLAVKDGQWYVVENYTASMYMTYLAIVLGQQTEYTPMTDSLSSFDKLLPSSNFIEEREVFKERIRRQVLSGILPIPDQFERLADIKEFKEKHYDMLRRFRIEIEEFIISLENLSDIQIEEKVELFTLKANDEIAYISDRMKNYKWQRISNASFAVIQSAPSIIQSLLEKNYTVTATETAGLLGAIKKKCLKMVWKKQIENLSHMLQ